MLNTKTGSAGNLGAGKDKCLQGLDLATTIIDPRPYTTEEKLLIMRANLNNSKAVNPFDCPIAGE